MVSIREDIDLEENKVKVFLSVLFSNYSKDIGVTFIEQRTILNLNIFGW